MIDVYKSGGATLSFLFQSFVVWFYLQHFFVIRISKSKFYCLILFVYCYWPRINNNKS